MPKRRRASSHAEFVADGVPEAHQALVKQVLANNAKLSKIKVTKLQYGIGIVASERIRKNEEITFIPKSLLVNLHDIPFPNSSPIDHPTKVHSALAAYFASKKHNGASTADPFISILPPSESFKTSMPIFWSDQILSNCSPWVRSFALKQQEKIAEDYKHAVEFHHNKSDGVEFSKEEYEWAWATVNTRTIYYRPKKWYKVPAEDCMTMCPLIDYYNHDWRNEDTCSVTFSLDGLRVTTQKAYETGEEIFVTYGEYNNDHLLVEYGFTLPNNESDNINLDFWVLKKLSPRHQKILEDISFHGYAATFSNNRIYSGSDLMLSDGDDSGYALDAAGACYRTTTALRLAVIPEGQLSSGVKKGGKRYLDFIKLVEGGMEEDDYVAKYEVDEEKAKLLLEGVVHEVEEFAREKNGKLEAMLQNGEFVDEKESISSAIGRWGQTLNLLASYTENSSQK
ncbi:hypothetical protein ABW20_dc0101122 [Dactylellina cionopaga]|nr:hypothetical protein ABW20_dc0101122 [Dactylellina cionopaga]